MNLFGFTIERRSTNPTPTSALLDILRNGTMSTSGVAVKPSVAIQVAAVQACIRVLAESVAQLPLHLHERVDDDTVQRASNHPLYPILHEMPNDEMTSVSFFEALMVDLCLYGNGYAVIERNGAGNVQALWPIPAADVTVDRDPRGRLRYAYKPTAVTNETTSRMTAAVYSPEEMWHIPGLSFNGITGKSPLEIGRDVAGNAIAADQYAAAWFQTGGVSKAILSHPGSLTPEAQQRIKQRWEAEYGHTKAWNQTPLLTEGMKLEQVAVSPRDAQFIDVRQFYVYEICRLFRMQPHMIALLDRSTWANIEHQGIDFVTHTLQPWLVRIERSITRCLLTAPERRRYYASFVTEGFLRGDFATRTQGYNTAIQTGWLSINDVRRLENLPPVDGGDTYLRPLNLTPITAPTEEVISDANDNA